MSTHISPCIVCGKDAACCEEEHVLSLTGCSEEHQMAICSVDCFLALRDLVDDRIGIISTNPAEYPRVAEALRDAAVIR